MSRLTPLNRGTRAAIVIDRNDPKAVAVCDGCGFWTMHSSLVEQKAYRGGSTLVGTGIYVCGTCNDVPNPYFSKMILGPDPVPVPNARTENLSLDPDPMQFIISDYNDYIITGVNPMNYTNDGFNYLVGNNP